MKKENSKNTTEVFENEENLYTRELFEERFQIVVSDYENELKMARTKLKEYNSESARLRNDINNTKRAFVDFNHEDIAYIGDRLSKRMIIEGGSLSKVNGRIETYEKEAKLYEKELQRLESAKKSIFVHNIFNQALEGNTFSSRVLDLELDLAHINGRLCRFELDYEVFTTEINRLNSYKNSVDVTVGIRDWLFEKVHELEYERAEIEGFIKSHNRQVEIYKKQIHHYKNWG